MSDVTVIVPYRHGDEHRDRLWAWCRKWWTTWFPQFVVTVADSAGDEFNRGAARNVAARCAEGDILVIADADTIVDPPRLEDAVEAVRTGTAPWVIPYAEGCYYNLSATATARRLQFAPDPVAPITEPWDPEDWEFKLTSSAGCLVVRKGDYWTAGGHPEFPTWGYEDDCFRDALDVLVGPHQRTPGFALHLWHPASEEQRFGNPLIDYNRKVARQYKRATTKAQMTQVVATHGSRQ